MMIQAIRLTRKKAALAVILAGAVLAALILLLGQHGGNVGASEQPCLSSNGERVAYLRELGDRPGAADHAAISAAAQAQRGLHHLQRSAKIPRLRLRDLLRQAGDPLHLHRHQLSPAARRRSAQPLHLRGPSGGWRCGLHRDRRISGHIGFPTANGCLLIADCSTGPPTSNRAASSLLPLSSPLSSKPPKCLIHFVFQHPLIPLKIQNPEAVGNTKLNWA